MALKVDYVRCANMLKGHNAVCVFVDGEELAYKCIGKGRHVQLRAIVYGVQRAKEPLDVSEWELTGNNYPPSLLHIVREETSSAAALHLKVLCAAGVTLKTVAKLDAKIRLRGFLGNAVVVVQR